VPSSEDCQIGSHDDDGRVFELPLLPLVVCVHSGKPVIVSSVVTEQTAGTQLILAGRGGG